MATQQSWTRGQIRRVLSLTERQIRSWEQLGLVPHQDTYALPDVTALRALNALREKRVPLGRIQQSFRSLRERLSNVANPFAELKIFTEGRRIGVHLAGQKMDSISGQLLLDFEVDALKKLASFPRRDIQSPADVRRHRAESDEWFQRGIEIEQVGGAVAEAKNAYERAVKLYPKAAGALVNLGTIYFHQRQWQKAEEYYRQAVEADPEYPLAQFNLGNLYDERGERAKAMVHYHAALRLRPQYADAHYNLALLHQAAGDVMPAVQHWSDYLKLDPASQWAGVARRELAKLKKATVISGARAMLYRA